MHSPDLVSSSLQTQFEYPRQQHSENALYIHVALTFATMKGVVLPLSVNQGQSGMFVHHSFSERRKRQIWYTGNRMRPVPLDAKDL